MAEKMKEHSFMIRLNEAESERFEAFVHESGMKKIAIARKAILRYIEEKEQK